MSRQGGGGGGGGRSAVTGGGGGRSAVTGGGGGQSMEMGKAGPGGVDAADVHGGGFKSDDPAYDDSIPIAVQAQERKRRKRRIMKIAVYIMFGIISVGVFAIWLFHKDPVEYLRFGTEFIFTVKLRSLEVRNYGGDVVLYADVGKQLLATPYDHCWDDLFENYEKNCLYWRKMARIRVSEYTNSSRSSCYTMKWEGIMDGFQAEDCFYLQHYHWFGYLVNGVAAWPISDVVLPYTNYYPSYPTVQNENLVPVWYGSQSVAVFVEPRYPFSVSWNDTDKRQFCIQSVNSPEDRESNTLLEYTICQGKSPQDIFTATHTYRFERDAELLDNTTSQELAPLRPMYGLSNVEDVNVFINEVTKNGSEWSLVELFEDWQEEAGDMLINPKLKDEINYLIRTGDNRNYKPAFPISPFFSYKSKHFQDGIEQGYFVKDSLNLTTRMMKFRGSEGAALDVTNSEATNWFLSLLRKLIYENGIKALKILHQDVPLDSSFRDTNVTYLEYNRIFYHRLASLNVTLVLEMAAGFITAPVYTPVKMGFIVDEPSGSACMRFSLPYSFTLGMSGFPLLIAEADLETVTNKDRFIRWLQVAIFYPVLKMSNISHLQSFPLQEPVAELLALRTEKFLPYLLRVWKEQPGKPIIRPLWWSAYQDKNVFGINDQFMVGDHLLVAPLLCEGASTRSVYLPEGTWLGPGMELFEGPLVMKDIPTRSFSDILHFWRQEHVS